MHNATSFIVDKIEHPGKPGAIQFTRRFEGEEIVGFIHACPAGAGYGPASISRITAKNQCGIEPGTIST